jgi:predicted nucleic acid-binding protein
MDFAHFNKQVEELAKKDQVLFREKMQQVTKSIENLNVEPVEIPKDKAIEAYKIVLKHDREFAMEIRTSAQVLQGPLLQRHVNLKTVSHSDSLLKQFGFCRRQLNLEIIRQKLEEDEEIIAFKK